MIRPFKADGLLALKAENIAQHGFYLKKDGWAVVNSHNDVKPEVDMTVFTVDAENLARKIENPRSVNLVLLGFTMAATSKKHKEKLFCTVEDMKAVLENRLAHRKKCWMLP